MKREGPVEAGASTRAISLWQIVPRKPKREARGAFAACLSAALVLPAGAAIDAVARTPMSEAVADPTKAQRALRAGAAACAMHGKVLTEEGYEAGGAIIRVREVVERDGDDRTEDPRDIERTTTVADGTFCLHVRPARRVRISARHPVEGEAESAELESPPEGGDRGAVVLVLARAVDLAGVVVDDLGDPISNASVRVERAGEGQQEPVLASTDDQGRFDVSARPDGGYRLTAWASGFAPRALPLVVRAGAPPVRMVLAAYAPPRVQVLDGEGHHIAGASVTVCIGAARISLTSSDDGTIELGPHEVGCTAVAHHPRFARSLPVLLRAGRTAELRLRPGGIIEGVVGDAGGRALDGVSVQIATYQPARGEPAFPDGSWGDPQPVAHGFRLRGLAPGTYGLRFVREWSDGESGGMEDTSMDAIEVRAGGVTRGLHVVLGDTAPAEEAEPATEEEAPSEEAPAEGESAPSDEPAASGE